MRQRLLRSHYHDWRSDTYSLGAYTYVPRGSIHASDELSTPVEKTLFFAGEHTDTTGHWGTVHAALRPATARRTNCSIADMPQTS